MSLLSVGFNGIAGESATRHHATRRETSTHRLVCHRVLRSNENQPVRRRKTFCFRNDAERRIEDCTDFLHWPLHIESKLSTSQHGTKMDGSPKDVCRN